MVIRSGSFVEERLEPGETGQRYSQQLSIDTIYRQRGDAVVGSSGVVRRQRTELSRRTRHHYRQRGREDADSLLREAGVDPGADEEFYRLNDEETYFVEFAEEPSVPDGHLGIVRPRDNCIGAGIRMETTYVDPEDEGCEALLSLEERFALVSASAAIADMFVIEPTDD